MDHLIYLVKAAKEAGVPETFIHFFGDGRDTAPKSAHGYLTTILSKLDELNYGKIATITGRYYAMDRDKRWDRVEKAFNALVKGEGEKSGNLLQTILDRYAADQTDEFLTPIIATGVDGSIKDGDTVITFNFRSDRMREISQALGISPPPFETTAVPKDIEIISMTQYKADFPFKNIFPPQVITLFLALILSHIDNGQCIG